MFKEAFDPKDSKYKKVDDLPEEHRGDFVNIPEEQGDGFVRKDAAENFLEAKKEADYNLKKGRLDEITPEEVVYEQANIDKEFIKGIIKTAQGKGNFSGIERNVSTGGYRVSLRNDDYSVNRKSYPESGSISPDYKTIDITNELFHDGLINKKFFFDLARGGIEIDANVIPEELTDQEDFILALNEYNPRQELPLSEKCSLDRNLLFKLAEQGANLDQIKFRSNDQIEGKSKVRRGKLMTYEIGRYSSIEESNNLKYLTQPEFLAEFIEHIDIKKFIDKNDFGRNPGVDLLLPKTILSNKDLLKSFILKDPLLVASKCYEPYLSREKKLLPGQEDLATFMDDLAKTDSTVEKALEQLKEDILKKENEREK